MCSIPLINIGKPRVLKDSNVLYNLYKNKTIPEQNKFIYDWKEVYKCRKLVNEKQADKYKKSVTDEITQYGEMSEYIQTQYYCSFKVRGGRFVTMDDLDMFDVFQGEMCDNIADYNSNQYIYRIASYDPALSEDYAALTIGVAIRYPGEGRFKVSLKNCYILNEIGIQTSSETLLSKVVEFCDDNMIDMIIVD